MIQVCTSFSFFSPPPPHPLFLLLRLFFIFVTCDIQLAICLRDRYTVTILKPQTCERCDLVASLCAKFQAHGDRGWPEILTLRFELKWIDLLTLHAVDKTIHPFIVCELLHCIHDRHSWMCTTGSKGWEMNRVVELERDGNLIWNGGKNDRSITKLFMAAFPVCDVAHGRLWNGGKLSMLVLCCMLNGYNWSDSPRQGTVFQGRKWAVMYFFCFFGLHLCTLIAYFALLFCFPQGKILCPSNIELAHLLSPRQAVSHQLQQHTTPLEYKKCRAMEKVLNAYNVGWEMTYFPYVKFQ